MSAPENHTIPASVFSSASKVVLDLETTDLAIDCDITQVAASLIDGSATFERYVIPGKDISPGASKVTGLYSHLEHGQRALFKNGKRLDASSLPSALTAFVDWLPSKSVLLAHNGCTFDMRVLVKALQGNGLLELATGKLAGFVDTLPVLKEVLSSSSTSSSVSYSLGAIHQRLFKEPISGAHDALADVHALRKVLAEAKPADKAFMSSSTTTSSAELQTSFAVGKIARERRLVANLCPAVVTKYMASKIAASGLSYEHLRTAFSRDREGGMAKVLSEKTAGGSVRVTSSRRIAVALQDHFRLQLQQDQ